MTAALKQVIQYSKQLNRFSLDLNSKCRPLHYVKPRFISKDTMSAQPLVSEDLKVEYLRGNDEEGIVVVGLNRPKARNALSRNLMTLFKDAFENLRFDKNVRVVILRSLVPGIFCAGADLKERATIAEHEVGPLVARGRALISELHEFPTPIIAALDGAALGGGLEIALSCDLRVAASNAKMGLVETRLAIIPGAGGTQRLPRIIGPARAKELIYTARILDGEEAERMNLVNHAVKQNANGDAAYLRSLELAKEICPNGPIALRMAKMAINKGIEVDLASGLAYEQAYYNGVIPTKDRTEGIMAFIEKRPPRFTGE